MKSKKFASRNKILIAVSMLILFVVTALVSVVLVLSANNQDVSTNIKISYVVDGVGARVSASYEIIPNNKTS